MSCLINIYRGAAVGKEILIEIFVVFKLIAEEKLILTIIMSDKQKQTSLVTLFEKMKEHSKKQEENNENQSENATLQDSSDVVLEAMLC